MRYGSKQRDSIVAYLRTTRSHPTAHEIYERVRMEFPHVSLGTVYRNLDYLISNNIVKKVQIAGAVDRYDFVRCKHNHVICAKCGKLFDFEYPLDEKKVQEAIGENIRLCDTDFLVTGVCSDCEARG